MPRARLGRQAYLASFGRDRHLAAELDALRVAFAQISERVPAGEVPGLTKPDAEDACVRALFCVCELSGRQRLVPMEKKVSTSLKLLRKNHESLLVGGRVVILFVGRLRDQIPPREGGTPPRAEEEEDDESRDP